VIGKTAGKDAANDKPTYPAILGMEASRQWLADLTEQAIDSVGVLGDKATDLAALARFVAERQS
jgi:farnesyl diphosphate synthase